MVIFMKKTFSLMSLLAAVASGHVWAADTVLQFSGLCDNNTCSSLGPNGTTPAHAVASVTLSDLGWVADGGLYYATFSAVKNFSYTGPAKYALAANSSPILNGTGFVSTSASVEGITEFNIHYADGAAFFAGDQAGWGLGFYYQGLPMMFESSTQAGQWRVSAVPEPESYAMLMIGLGLVGWVGRRRKQVL